MKQKNFFWLILLAATILLQGCNINGRVVYEGIGLSGVIVTCDTSSSTTTDANGNYTFVNIGSGIHELSFTKVGYIFKPSNVKVITIKDVVVSDVEAKIAWSRVYGGNDYDGSHFVQQISDGGYILAGYTYSFGAGSSDAWLIKTDIYGNKLWDKTFGGSDNDMAYSVQQTSDGGYVLTGNTLLYIPSAINNAWLIKTDVDGNKLWDKTFDLNSHNYVNNIQRTSDGGYILSGAIASLESLIGDAWLIKTDADGNKLWDKTFGGINADGASYVQQTSDGGYIISGFTYSFGAGSGDAWLIKTDADGNMLWDKTFGGIDNEGFYSVQKTSDGGYILVGHTSSFGDGSVDAWLIKTDADGNKLWDKTFGGIDNGTDVVNSVQQTKDGGYILAGYTQLFNNKDAWLIKTDADGKIIIEEVFIASGSSGNSAIRSIQQTGDDGYILTGYTYAFGAGKSDLLLIKTDANCYAPVTSNP